MKPKLKKLPNKLRVLTIPREDTKAVTVLVLIKVGSRNEPAKLNGSSHFIEHLLFKGTEKRPNTQIISQELDKIGAEYNAFTGKDHTGFYIKAKANKLDFALDMLSDMLFNSKFDKEEIERERGVIMEEM
ncbi:insulinase family protein, partial [Patescibacteria group bacterium]|nr:insulinase family protein [Patescibacteria group bacterium]